VDTPRAAIFGRRMPKIQIWEDYQGMAIRVDVISSFLLAVSV